MLLLVIAFSSCNKLEITMPRGPQGPQGDQGIEGLSAYEVWVRAVGDGSIDDWNGGTEIYDYFIYLKGKDGADGKDGKDGRDGLSAYEVWMEYISSGDVDDPQNPGAKWSPSRNSLKDFFTFLTGPKGSDGLVPYIGGNGNWWIGNKDTGCPARGAKGDKGDKGDKGETGLSAYEYWVECVKRRIIIHEGDTTEVEFFRYFEGKDGADGLTPFIGDNGNWWIGDIDTGVPAAGQDGKDGVDGRDGKDGVDGRDGKDGVDGQDGKDGKDGKDGRDGKDGADGQDGKDGLDAYQVWKEQVISKEGLENPGNGVYPVEEYPLWPADKVSLQDYWDYLQGRDGKSAYEIWKEMVLSYQGLVNPGNGVYDLEEYPLWPKDKIDLSDYYDYLRGRNGDDGEDGKDGKDGESYKETIYIENVVDGYYNVAPVNSLMLISWNTATSAIDTTYETVSPITGGAAFIVTSDGGAILPGCQVTFTDLTGKTTYTKTSDEDGYIYLTRDELPEYKAGDPSGFNKNNAVKPTSFTFNGKTITDETRIAKSCIVPYRVNLEFPSDTYDVNISGYPHEDVVWNANVSRIVEGKPVVVRGRNTTNTVVTVGCGRAVLDNKKQPYGYFNYMNKADSQTNSVALASSSISKDGKILLQAGAYYSSSQAVTVQYQLKRPVVDDGSISTMYRTLSYGDGANPAQISVHYTVGTSATITPDYGMKITNPFKVHVPELRRMGNLDVTGKTGSSISYNGKTVRDLNDESTVEVNRSNYELVIGKTSFSFGFDLSSFGQCYIRKTFVKEENGEKVIEFQRYDSLMSFLSSTSTIITSRQTLTNFRNSGYLNGSKIDNSITIYYRPLSNRSLEIFALENDVEGPCLIRNVYDGFNLKFDNVEVNLGGSNIVSYAPVSGTFHYVEGEYVAKPELGGMTYRVQTIIDGKTDPAAL